MLTPARHCLLLDGAHEPSAVALSAHVSRDEEMADIAGAAPGPAIGSADDPGVRPAEKDAKQRAVPDAGGLHVEVIKLLLKEAGVVWGGIGLDGQERSDSPFILLSVLHRQRRS